MITIETIRGTCPITKTIRGTAGVTKTITSTNTVIKLIRGICNLDYLKVIA